MMSTALKRAKYVHFGLVSGSNNQPRTYPMFYRLIADDILTLDPCSYYCWQVVIHEALMLLRDTSAAESECISSGGDGGGGGAIVRRFIGAVQHTRSLAKPSYIVMSRDKPP